MVTAGHQQGSSVPSEPRNDRSLEGLERYTHFDDLAFVVQNCPGPRRLFSEKKTKTKILRKCIQNAIAPKNMSIAVLAFVILKVPKEHAIDIASHLQIASQSTNPLWWQIYIPEEALWPFFVLAGIVNMLADIYMRPSAGRNQVWERLELNGGQWSSLFDCSCDSPTADQLAACRSLAKDSWAFCELTSAHASCPPPAVPPVVPQLDCFVNHGDERWVWFQREFFAYELQTRGKILHCVKNFRPSFA